MKSVSATYKTSAGILADRIGGALFLTDTNIFFDLHPLYEKSIVAACAPQKAMIEAATWSVPLEQVSSCSFKAGAIMCWLEIRLKDGTVKHFALGNKWSASNRGQQFCAEVTNALRNL